ncbi:MAG: lipocalin-like domain-containing protein [Gemmatimonadaceae bacterium]
MALLPVMIACNTAKAPVAPVPVVDSLRGTWRIAAFEIAPDADTTQHPLPFGVSPVGYLVYDATGHVFWQVYRRSAMDSLMIGRQRHLPDSMLMRLSRGFSAQFGTYSVDAQKRTVTHHHEGELPPWGESFEVATPFRLAGDSLFIGASDWRFVRVK